MGWLLVLGLKDCLVECAIVCIKSVVILIMYIEEHLRNKVLPLSGPRIGGANDPLGPLGSADPGVALRTKKKKITSLSFGVSIVCFKVYGRYQFQFNKIGGPQDMHVKPEGRSVRK